MRLSRIVPSPFERRGSPRARLSRGIYRSSQLRTRTGCSWRLVLDLLRLQRSGLLLDVQWSDAETVYATNAREPDSSRATTAANLGSRSALARVWQWFPLLQDLAVDPLHPLNAYATYRAECGALPQGVAGTRDGGITWFDISEGLLGWRWSDLALDPVTPNRLYVSAEGGGILAYDLQVPEPCVPSATALCITDGPVQDREHLARFRRPLWRRARGAAGERHGELSGSSIRTTSSCSSRRSTGSTSTTPSGRSTGRCRTSSSRCSRRIRRPGRSTATSIRAGASRARATSSRFRRGRAWPR